MRAPVILKQAGLGKTLKTVGTVGIPLALLGGGALYLNNKTKKKPNYTGNYFKYQPQTMTYRDTLQR